MLPIRKSTPLITYLAATTLALSLPHTHPPASSTSHPAPVSAPLHPATPSPSGTLLYRATAPRTGALPYRATAPHTDVLPYRATAPQTSALPYRAASVTGALSIRPSATFAVQPATLLASGATLTAAGPSSGTSGTSAQPPAGTARPRGDGAGTRGVVLPSREAAADSGGFELSNTDVTFRNGGTVLHGTVVAPAGADRRPGMVLVAGSGARGRNAYRPEAEAFARAGIVVLIYDKRPGYTRATSTFTDLADDAVAGVRLLRTRPDVDPGKVGVWGHSEGGWVAPLAAARSAEVSFVVPVAASALHTDRAQLWSNRVYLTHYGVKQSLQPPIGMNLSRMLVSSGLFGDVANDPLTTLEKVRQPLLAVFAEHDRSTAPGESVILFRQALDRAHNTHYTLRVIPQADHNLHQSTTGFAPHSPAFAPGYVDTITHWVTHLPPSKPTSDAPPAQSLASEPLHPLSWYESIPLHLTLPAVMLAAFLAYPVGALTRTIRTRLRRSAAPYPASSATRHLARLTVVTGTTTVLGTITYLFWIVATGATTVGPTILGRPPLWLLLQLLAVTTIAAGTTLTLRRSPRIGVRQALLTTATAAFIPWSLYWGLLTP